MSKRSERSTSLVSARPVGPCTSWAKPMKRIVSSALIASFALSSSYARAAGKFTKKEAEISPRNRR